MRIDALGRTDRGLVRERNEDSGYVGRQLFVVADGLGGHAGGDVASSLLVGRLEPLDAEPFDDDDEALAAVVEAIEDAHRIIRERAATAPELSGMGSTCTVALLRPDLRVLLAQVGDTRGYLLRDGELRQVTSDHSFVGALVEAGYITADEARTHPQRSVVLRAVGIGDAVEVETFAPLDLQEGDAVLLVSDGVHAVVTDEQILEVVAGRSLAEACDGLISAAQDGGGPDNITVVALRAVADDGAPAAARPPQEAAAAEGRPPQEAAAAEGRPPQEAAPAAARPPEAAPA